MTRAAADRRPGSPAKPQSPAASPPPNIVTVHDFGSTTHNGQTCAYLVMELLPGKPLSAALEAGRLPLPQALHVATCVADALNTAPDAGLTHRDIKPPDAVLVWLAAAQRGATRRRTSLQDPHAAASVSAMAARTTTINKFTWWCRRPLNLPVPKATPVDRLSPTEATRTLRLLSGHPPAKMFTSTWERTIAVLALAVATRHGIAELHPLRLEHLALDQRLPHVLIGGEPYPLDTLQWAILTRGLGTHAAITTRIEGGQVQELWVTTAPGRPRGGRPVPPPGMPAARRTLEAAHRVLMMEALGTPLLLEQFCSVDPDE
ncbi:hypothetical protein OHB06_01215 [Streptomyces sp. NBC_01604]|uniref:hypothetical protein n=1 Tax=Streptomyces sp. NBC_01604 TaxID=2975894 RepID=UPI00386F00F8